MTPSTTSIHYTISDSSTTSQYLAILPSSVLYRSADFMVTLSPVCLFVAVVVSIAKTWSSSARTIWSIVVRESGNS
jgi:hypothetical protein